jgi:hypothetical protein
MDRVLDLERQGWDSLCDGTAGKFYDRLMHPDGLMVLANGQVMDHDDVVEALSDAPPWDDYAIDDPRFVSVGADGVALVYTATGYRAGAAPFVGVMVSVYVREGSDWRLMLYQQTAKPT